MKVKEVTVKKFVFDSEEINTIYEVLDEFISDEDMGNPELRTKAEKMFDEIGELWEKEEY